MTEWCDKGHLKSVCVCAPSSGYHPSRGKVKESRQSWKSLVTSRPHWRGWQGGVLVCKNWNCFSLFHIIHDICKVYHPDCREDGSSQMDCYDLDNPSQIFWEDTVNPDSPSQVCLEPCPPGDSRFWKVDSQPSHHHRTLGYWEYLFLQRMSFILYSIEKIIKAKWSVLQTPKV